ncbi:hypothetical protein J5N97_010425 [Dioscorea zingiberensis]|uniref:NAC domain-containing protein n=1 Tax=Dioscorea zingiberensis TaxID=325984 RepID=A0A9D5HMF7_9LILI|nr:hypothetical protein J5N97_010425 [Dioscorea zingiberensis]
MSEIDGLDDESLAINKATLLSEFHSDRERASRVGERAERGGGARARFDSRLEKRKEERNLANFSYDLLYLLSNSRFSWYREIAMCPPPPDWLQFGGYALSTDEDIVLFLGAWEFGDPIPTNVITEVDPLSIEPWNLPEGMLYLCSLNDPQIWKGNSEIKETSAGYWKSEGGVFRVSTSSFMVGRKTTREFYEGHMPFGKRTGWMMHEYQADQKACQGMMATKEYSSLCRVFRQSDQNPKHEEQLKCVDANCMDDADVDGERVEAMLRLFLEEEERNHSLHDGDDGA